MPETDQKITKVPGHEIRFCPDCKWFKTTSKGNYGETGTKGFELVLCKACHERLNGFKRVCSICGNHEPWGGYEETSGGSWEKCPPCSNCKGSGEEP